MEKIDGKAIAEKILAELKKKKRPEKTLAAVLVGDNAQSESFLKQKEKIAAELGIKFVIRRLSEKNTQADLMEAIGDLNGDCDVGGVIIQLPLPSFFDRGAAIKAVNVKKDIDALNDNNDLVLSPAVEVVKEILSANNYDLSGKAVAVVGSGGFLIGRPIGKWLEGKCKKNIALDIGGDFNELKEADLVICGAGKAGLIKTAMLKDGAALIDFGCSMVKETSGERGKEKIRIKGDFDVDSLKASRVALRFFTPTPGGTGPILVAELFKNFYKLNS